MLQKTISGGQTGADQGGLRAARALGLATGGWMPKGFLTLEGSHPELARELGLQEHTSPRYPPRTQANMKESDGTIRLARNFNSRGEICTLKFITHFGKPFLDINIDAPLPLDEVRAWLVQHNIRVLNVAGNTERQVPGIEQFVISYLAQVLSSV